MCGLLVDAWVCFWLLVVVLSVAVLFRAWAVCGRG